MQLFLYVELLNTPGCVSVYSDDEEQEDLLVSLVQQIRKKKPSKSRRRRRSVSEDEESEAEERRGSQSGHRKRRRRRKTTVLDKVDKILELKKEGKKKKYSESRMMKKVDKILFSDISSAVSKEERAKARDKFLNEVDDILGLGRKQEEEEESSKSSDEESEDEDDLTEGEMRLLNLINHNKIDVKVNFPSEYRGDTDCHFCRKKETSHHLAKCPVYQGIMRGSEFRDLKSRDVRVVKAALENIKSALIKRSEALSVTSLGGVSAANMKLLNLSLNRERKKTKAEIIDEILRTT